MPSRRNAATAWSRRDTQLANRAAAVIPIEATGAWQAAYPDGRIGVLEIAQVDNATPSPRLEAAKRRLEEALRARYQGRSRADLVAAPVMSAYVRYYRRFEKTYHVLLQLESVALKGKPLPAVSPLVDANFAAELDTLVLTAGHDAATLQPPLVFDVSRAGDTMQQMSGALKSLPEGDMVMRDAGGLSCSILYGQDKRSPLSAASTHALYVAYAPPGVPEDAVRRQLESVLAFVRMGSPECRLEQMRVIGGDAATA
jgi:DNA/RNA-binding domain of Phe-tRNA-synthetase-like protein